MRFSPIVLLLFLSSFTEAHEPYRTHPPRTYVIGYSNHFIEGATSLEQALADSPDILHTGVWEVPFNSQTGPMKGISGEEKYTLLTPAEVKQKIEHIQAFTQRIKAAGVSWAIPYICNQTMFGDAEKRLGFWDFYDHWEDYREFGLPPKPARDPLQWNQRNSDGTLHTTYPFEAEYAKPGFRYQPSPPVPEWNEYLKFCVRMNARCGYNGIFVDNCILHSYDRDCEEQFDTYLKNRYGERLRRVFGSDDLAELNLIDPQQGESGEGYGKKGLIGSENWTPEKALLWAETQRFWATAVAEQIRGLKQAGQEETGGEFIIIPNYGTLSRIAGVDGRRRDAKDILRYAAVSDWVMLEEELDCGLLAKNLTLDYHLAYKMGMAYGARWAMLPYTTHNRATYELIFAEMLAGGGGAFVETEPGIGEVRNRYAHFIREHPEAWEDCLSYAEIAVVFDYEQLFFENLEHLRQVFELARFLGDRGYLFDLVAPENASRLSQYKFVFIPNLLYVSESLHNILSTIPPEQRLVIGEYAIYDETAQPAQRELKSIVTVSGIRELLKPRIGERGVPRDAMLQMAFSASKWLADPGMVSRLELMFQYDRITGVSRNEGYFLYDWLFERAVGEGRNRKTTGVFGYGRATGMKANAYLREDGREFYLHLVNYNLPLVDDNGKAIQNRSISNQKNLPVYLPMMEGKNGGRVVQYSPFRERPVELTIQNRDRIPCLILPDVGTYELIRITLP